MNDLFLKEPMREVQLTLSVNSVAKISFEEPMIITCIRFNHNDFLMKVYSEGKVVAWEDMCYDSVAVNNCYRFCLFNVDALEFENRGKVLNIHIVMVPCSRILGYIKSCWGGE